MAKIDFLVHTIYALTMIIVIHKSHKKDFFEQNTQLIKVFSCQFCIEHSSYYVIDGKHTSFILEKGDGSVGESPLEN